MLSTFFFNVCGTENLMWHLAHAIDYIPKLVFCFVLFVFTFLLKTQCPKVPKLSFYSLCSVDRT